MSKGERKDGEGQKERNVRTVMEKWTYITAGDVMILESALVDHNGTRWQVARTSENRHARTA